MSRWMVNNIFAMGVLSEKNYWLKMGRETHSNINYLSAWSYSWITVCERSITQPKLIGTNHTSFLLILTWFALFSIKFHRYNQMWASEWACLLKPFFFLVFGHCVVERVIFVGDTLLGGLSCPSKLLEQIPTLGRTRCPEKRRSLVNLE